MIIVEPRTSAGEATSWDETGAHRGPGQGPSFGHIFQKRNELRLKCLAPGATNCEISTWGEGSGAKR